MGASRRHWKHIRCYYGSNSTTSRTTNGSSGCDPSATNDKRCTEIRRHNVIVESKAHLSFSPLQAVPPPVAVRSTTIVPVPSSRPSIPHPDRPRAKYVAGGHRPSTSTPPPPVPVLTRRLEFPQDPRAIFGRRTAGRPLGDSDSAASTKREMQRRTPGP